MHTPEQESRIDFWHFQCQKFQFLILIYKYGLDSAIDMMTPKWHGHWSKSEAMNAKYIHDIDKLTLEYDLMEPKFRREVLLQKLHFSINILRRLKGGNK